MEIKYTNAADTVILHTKIRWSHYMSRMVKLFAIGYLAGIGIVWYGLSTDTMIESTKNEQGIIYNTHDWHIAEALGIVILAFTTYFVFRLFAQKRKIFSDLNSTVARWRARYNTGITIIFDNVGVRYYTPELNLEARWPLIKSYSHYKEHILLHMTDEKEASIIADSKLLSSQEREDMIKLFNLNNVTEL